MEKNKTQNPTAFPSWDMTFDKNPNSDLFSAGTSQGMTLRDYFAAKAMQSLVQASYMHFNENFTIEDVVEQSFIIADQMLITRNEQ